MPPRKRTTRSSAATSGGRQTPLAFGTSKITKPSSFHAGKDLGKGSPAKKAVDEVTSISNDSARTTPLPEEEKQATLSNETQITPLPDEAQDEPTPSLGEASTLRDARDKQVAQPVESFTTIHTTVGDAKGNADEQRARDVSEAQIRKYWKAKEDVRTFPRVHQQGLSLHEKVLREFDLSSQYGPCIGVARTKRWHRAHKLGLSPPIEVLAVLLREVDKENGGDKGKRVSGGSDDGRGTSVQVAYIDELMGAKGLVEEVR